MTLLMHFSRLPAMAMLFAALATPAVSKPGSRDESPCTPRTFEGHSYTVCEAALNRYAVRIFWQRPEGKPYNYLKDLPKSAGNGEHLLFALNGGMFRPDYSPVGLYVEGGHEFVRANTNNGPGNFHLKPNGIFYVGDGKAGVIETGAFLKKRPK